MTVTSDEITALMEGQKPTERVKRLFLNDPRTGEPYLEAQVADIGTYLVTSIAGSAAFAISAPRAKDNFLRANAVTVYKTKWLANRQAMDAFMIGGLKKGLKWGFIAYLITKPFITMAQGLELYRCKTSCVNYAASGALVGGLSRCLLGPRGMLAGALIGGYAGSVTGFIITTIMKLSHITVEERFFDEMTKMLEEERYYKENRERASKVLNDAEISLIAKDSHNAVLAQCETNDNR